MPKILKRQPKEDPYINVAAQVLEIVNHNASTLNPNQRDHLIQETLIYITGYTEIIRREAYKQGKNHSELSDVL